MGEVLKTGLICDGEFYEYLLTHSKEILDLDRDSIKKMIRRCCEIKAGVVERDPKEQGERALLNLGHTVGHAIEKLKDFQLLHGQCVGIGMIAAARLSVSRGMLSEEEFRKICKGNQLYGLPSCADGLTAQAVLDATKKDKKMENGQIKFILMDGLGHSVIDRSVTDEELLSCIKAVLA
jgi:3-dehydroquinate synthase